MSIGNEIRRLRKGKGLTLQDLAGKMEISVSYLSQVEKNEKAPNEKIYKGMFKVFGVHLAELEGGEGEALAHIAVNGLSGVKVEALRGLAEKFKEAGDTEFYELMGTVSRALDELERKRLSGELKPPWQDFKKALQRASDKAGISQHVYMHLLRHGFGTHSIQSGINLRSLQILMGHSSSQVTEIYTTLAGQYLGQEIEKFGRGAMRHSKQPKKPKKS